MRTIIDCDLPWSMSAAEKNLGITSEPGVLPRLHAYGTTQSLEAELQPYGDYADKLVDPKDFKEVIQRCHDLKIFPMYHQQRSWAPPGYRWSQNGLNYCWSWAGIAAFMDLLAREGKLKVGDEILAAVAMGFTVGWRNAGNYLPSLIKGLKERGCPPISFVPDEHSTRYRNYKDGWEEAAMNNRLAPDGVFDCDPRNMLQHAVTGLQTASGGYAAWNRLSHAMSVVGLIWDESKYNNVRWVIRNSHDEDDFIEMTGRNAAPDELFFLNASTN